MIATPRERRAGGALPIDVASRGLSTFDVVVDPRDVVFVKGVVEASDGLATIFAEQSSGLRGAATRAGGDLSVACPPSREVELRALLADLGLAYTRRPELEPQEIDRVG